MMRFVPPAGSPLKVRHVLHSLSTSSSNGRARAQLEALAPRLSVKHVFGASSGRAALAVALDTLHRLRPDRDVVAVPAYTCFSVAAAIVRAGLKIRLVDVDPNTLDFDLSGLAQLSGEKLLCIVPCNLFGFPNEMSALQKVTGATSAFVIDDAAQALGSTRDGANAGTRGDLGIYSLGRGKSLGAVGGGLLVTASDEIANALRGDRRLQAGYGGNSTGQMLGKMLSYSVFVHPTLYSIPNAMPFLKLGTTEFDPHFEIGQLHPLTLGLLENLLDELDEINRLRQRNAAAIRNGLRSNDLFAFPMPAFDARPTFVRLPVVAREAATRDAAVSRLRAAGIGATAFYPHAICDIPGIEAHMAKPDFHCSRAEDLSRRLLTLPVHPFVKRRDIDRMAEVLNALQEAVSKT
jgi:perosamine synthetase